MAIGCDEVRALLSPSGDAAPLSDERAEQVAEHLDQCDECDRQLSRRIGHALDALPVGARPSLQDVRRLARQRQFFVIRLTAAAAALLVILGTGWALMRPPTAAPARPVPPPPVVIDEPIPDPIKIADLPESDRRLIRSESVLTPYLQFCLSCINRPTPEDKNEFLIRSLLIFRE